MRSPVAWRGSTRALVTIVLALETAAGCSSPASSPRRDGGGSKDSATDEAIFATWWSNTVLGNPAHDLMGSSVKETVTYRSYARPHAAGATRWRFWTSNATDSTYDAGPIKPNRLGGSWRIEAAYAGDGGTSPTGALEPGTARPVLFDGQSSKEVEAGERFWSDAVDIAIPDGHLLAFSWSISTFGVVSLVPYAHAPIVSSFLAKGTSLAAQESAAGYTSSGDRLVAPQAFATEPSPSVRRLCFLGDSITQGIGSSKDSYGFWAAKIARGLGPEVAVWNLGSGWARAADAASDGYWLYKAKQCAEVIVALGVNDLNTIANLTAATLLGDLGKVVASLRQHTPGVKIILFTVPPYNYAGAKYAVWKETNDAILGGAVVGADRAFDVGAVLSQPAPNDGLSRPETINGTDAHPNDAGSTAIAEAFLAWYRAI